MRGLNLTQLTFWLGTCALCGVLLAARPSTGPILHVPDEPSQARAERMVKEVFAKEYGSKTAAGRQALARKMIQQAMETRDDAAARFVLLREARDIAASAADPATAQRAIRLMAEFYAIDATKMLAAAMNLAHQSATTPEAQTAVAQTCLSAVDQAVVGNDYSTATRLIATAEAAANKARNVTLLGNVRDRNKTVQVIFLEFQAAEKSRKTLQDQPDDPDACARVGRFLCLYKNDWEKGLPLLARGAESALRSMARDDLAAAANVQKRLAIGDGWWELSQSQPQPVRRHLQARAAWWYRQILPQLNGIHRSIVQKRIESLELEAMKEQNLFPGLAAELFKGADFGQPIKMRIDEQINFDWGNEAADPALTKDNFALRWTGMIKAPAAGGYELIVVANTGVRLWLDEKLILDNANLARNRNGVRVPVQLDDQLHAIRLEYWDTSGLARMKLLWRAPGAGKDEVIPASVFFHEGSTMQLPAERQ